MLYLYCNLLLVNHLKNLGCEDNIPITCQGPPGFSCAIIAGQGGCDDNWAKASFCGNTPGKVKENCKKSCKNCRGRHTIIGISI